MVFINNEGSALVGITHSRQARADSVQYVINTHAVLLVGSLNDLYHAPELCALLLFALQQQQ
jgi:hypothetical protein